MSLAQRIRALGPRAWRRQSLGRGLFKPLRTPRCVLRLGALRDAASYARNAEHDGVAQWMLNFPSPFPLALAKTRMRDSWRRLEHGEAVSLVAIERATGVLVGGVALNNIAALPEPELAYWVAPPLWHQGFGREITQAMLGYAFDVRGDERVRASVLPGNQASSALLTALGFRTRGMEEVLAEPYAQVVGASQLEPPGSLGPRRLTESRLDARVPVTLMIWTLSRTRWERLRGQTCDAISVKPKSTADTPTFAVP